MKTHLRPDPTQPNTAASGDPWNTPPVAGRTKPAHRARAVLAPCRLAAALLLAAAPTLTIPTAAQNAEPPDLMSYQGFLVDGADEALAPDRPRNFTTTFRIYGSPDGDDLLWAEDQVVTVDKGNFSVALGEGAAHEAEPHGGLSGLFVGVNSAGASHRYLETTVIINDREQTLLPRLRLVPSAYSFLAARAIVADSARRVELPEGAGFISDQGGSLKLGPGPGGSGNPYIDFRNGSQEPNVQLVNNAPGQLSLQGDLSVTGKVNADEFLLDGSPAWKRDPARNGIFYSDGVKGIGIGRAPQKEVRLDIQAANPANAIWIRGDGGKISHSFEVDQSGYGSISLFGNDEVRTILSGSGLLSFPESLGPKISLYGGFGFGIQAGKLQIYTPGWEHDIVLGFGASDSLTEVMRVRGAGDVVVSGGLTAAKMAIGGATHDYRYSLNVTGDAFVSGWLWTTFGGALFKLERNDSSHAYWASDLRLKRGIETIPSALDAVSRLRGVTWHWNEVGLEQFTAGVEENFRSISGRPEDDQKIWAEKRAEILEKQSKLQYGFVAQEVEQVFPDWVTTGENGYKQINMERLSAVLVEAIKEQQADLKAKAAKIESLEKRLASLEARDRARAAEFTALESLVRERLGVVEQASLRVNHASHND